MIILIMQAINQNINHFYRQNTPLKKMADRDSNPSSDSDASWTIVDTDEVNFTDSDRNDENGETERNIASAISDESNDNVRANESSDDDETTTNEEDEVDG